MTENEIKLKELNESIEYFDKFVNIAIQEKLDGITPIDLIKHYNILRNSLSQLYVE
jgi:DNA-directed RNA polymerase subunit K/omega